MQIEKYHFGQMTIDGRQYRSDVLIFPDGRVSDGWWRRRGHHVDTEDIADLVAHRPEIIIIGTGASGMMRTAPALADELRAQGIRMIAEPTENAYRRFNREYGSTRVAAGFHLTC